MIIRTRTKINLVRYLYRVVSFCRLLFGLSDRVQVRRGGINWDLDISEGIDFSIFVVRTFERSTAHALKSLTKSGDTILDIGANIGAHTLPLASAVGPDGHVIAFEPTDFAFSKLKRNLALNPEMSRRVTAEQMMLVAEAGAKETASQYSSWPLKERRELHKVHLGQQMTSLHAKSVRLDDYLKSNKINHVNLIKLDVDGHELQVLRGAVDCLNRFRPCIVMEFASYLYQEYHDSFVELIDLLNGYGYQYRECGSRKRKPLDSTVLQEQIPYGASINVILEIPA